MIDLAYIRWRLRRYAYVLEHFEDEKKPTVVGVFSSKRKALKKLKTLRKDFSYALYMIPLNRIITDGDDLKDIQGEYDHWHYGTNRVKAWNISEGDEPTTSYEETRVEWPE